MNSRSPDPQKTRVEGGAEGVAHTGQVELGEEGGGLCLTLWEWEPRYAAPRLVVHWRHSARADAHA